MLEVDISALSKAIEEAHRACVDPGRIASAKDKLKQAELEQKKAVVVRSDMTTKQAMDAAKKKATRTKGGISSRPSSTSTVIAHPGDVVHIGVRAGSKAKDLGSLIGAWWRTLLKQLQRIYAGKAYRVTSLADAPLENLAGRFDVVYDALPSREHTAEERDAVCELLRTGARLILVGENNEYAADDNQIITKCIHTLGGALIVRPTTNTCTNDDMEASENRINDLPLTAGVGSFNFDLWASLAVDSSCDVLMADTGRSGEIAMADFRLFRGNVTFWADIN